MLCVLFLIALFTSVKSLACTAQYQCSSVSTDYNYVSCSSGVCKCSSLGFVGNATTTNPCRCSSPYTVYWLNSMAYCINYNDAVAYKVDQAQLSYQLAVVKSVYQSLVWPTPAYIMGALIAGQASPVSSLIAANATGRVDPLGKFSDQDGVVEYFYGTVWTGAARVSKITFKKLISQNNVVSMNVQLEFDNYDNTQQYILYSYNLTQTGTFTFNSEGLIQSMDLIIHNLGENSNPLTPDTLATAQQICYVIMNVANCNSTFDPLGYYTDIGDCINHFTNVYDWGTWDNIYFNGNTSICRVFHSFLAIGRPQVHCSHSGKTGGGKCIHHEYTSYFLQDF
jgi:hypothetical protein